MLSFFGVHLMRPIYSVVDTTYAHASGFLRPVEEGTDLRPINKRLYSGFSRWTQSRAVKRYYEKIANETGLFVLRLPAFHALPAWRVAQELRIPYVVSIHGHWDRIFLHAPYLGLARAAYDACMARYTAGITQRILENAQHVFFLGHGLAERYAHCAQSSSIIAHFLHDASDVRDAPNLPPEDGSTRLLFVGELSVQKGLLVLMESARMLIEQGLNIEIEVAGYGPEEENLRKMNAEGPLRGRITLLGWLPPGQALDHAFERATILCLPSFAEGVPKVVIEALVRGVPVVATDVGDIRHLLGSGARGWVVKSQDSKELSNALHEAIQHRELRALRAEAGLRYAAQNTRHAQVTSVGEVLAQAAPDFRSFQGYE